VQRYRKEGARHRDTQPDRDPEIRARKGGTCIHLAVWLPTTAAAMADFSVDRPRAAPGARLLKSAGSSRLVAVAMAGGRFACDLRAFSVGKERRDGRESDFAAELSPAHIGPCLCSGLILSTQVSSCSSIQRNKFRSLASQNYRLFSRQLLIAVSIKAKTKAFQSAIPSTVACTNASTWNPDSSKTQTLLYISIPLVINRSCLSSICVVKLDVLLSPTAGQSQLSLQSHTCAHVRCGTSPNESTMCLPTCQCL
jgi:hypothetical protein